MERFLTGFLFGVAKIFFFRPVFNVADASISIGIALVFIFQKRFFGNKIEATSEEPIVE